MQTKVSFDVSEDSRKTVLTIESNLPITMPEWIMHFEDFLDSMKLTYAQEIIARKQAFESGKVVPFIKEIK